MVKRVTMINRYSEVKEYKKEIQEFIERLTYERKLKNEEIFRSIAKNILFFKILFLDKEDNIKHYRDSAINDMLYLTYILTCESSKIFFIIFRSLIENTIRVSLEYENDNATGINNMFREFREKYEDGKEYLDYVEGEYGKCCDVVHSNIQADIDLGLYFEEIKKMARMTDDRVVVYSKKLGTFLNKTKQFFVFHKTEMIMNKFYKQDEVLSFLLGEKMYNDYRINKKTIE